MAPKVVRLSSKLRQNFGENSEAVCMSYEINYNVLLTCNNRMKLRRQKLRFLSKRIRRIKILSPRLQCQSQTSFKDFIICTLLTYVDEITNYLDENLLYLWKVTTQVIQNSSFSNQNSKSKEL